LYVDGGPDLYTSETRANGNLDATGLAHLLALPGHLPQLAGIGPTTPLLTPPEVAYGHGPPTAPMNAGCSTTSASATSPPAGYIRDVAAAGHARAQVEAAAPAFVLHVDVDVLAFVGAPLSDVPEPFGLTLDELTASVAAFVASSRLAGLVITEINPDHVPDPGILQQFVTTLTTALAAP